MKSRVYLIALSLVLASCRTAIRVHNPTSTPENIVLTIDKTHAISLRGNESKTIRVTRGHHYISVYESGNAQNIMYEETLYTGRRLSIVLTPKAAQ